MQNNWNFFHLMSKELEEIKDTINSLHDIYVIAATGQKKYFHSQASFEAIKTQATLASSKLKKLLRSLAETTQHKLPEDPKE